MKEIVAFSGKKYKPQYQWKNNSYNAEDGTSFLGNGNAFFEIVINDILFRGDGKTLKDAESKAREKYEKYLNCDHQYERISEIGVAKCLKCNVKKVDHFENILKCKCEKKAIFYYKYCYEHYIEYLNTKIIENEDNTFYIFKKNITEYFKTKKLTDSEIIDRMKGIDDYMSIYNLFKEKAFKEIENLEEKNNMVINLIEKMQRDKKSTEYWLRYKNNELDISLLLKELID